MKNKKVFKIVSIVVLFSVLITAIFLVPMILKEPVTADTFKEVIESTGGTVHDGLEEMENSEGVDTYLYVVDGENLLIQFMEVDSSKRAMMIFSNNRAKLETYFEMVSPQYTTSKSFNDYASYSISGNGIYCQMVMVENTLLYVETKTDGSSVIVLL